MAGTPILNSQREEVLPSFDIAYSCFCFVYLLPCLKEGMKGNRKEGTGLSGLIVWIIRGMHRMVRLSSACLLSAQTFPYRKCLGKK